MYSLHFIFLSDEGPTLETLDFTIRIGSTPTFLYFDLYLYSAYAAHYVYFTNRMNCARFKLLRATVTLALVVTLNTNYLITHPQFIVPTEALNPLFN